MEKYAPRPKFREVKTKEILSPNQLRHCQNLAILTGFWHGLYFLRGVSRPNTEKSKNGRIKP